MASTQPPKLTKKQKKGIAFWERRTIKEKRKDGPSVGEIPSHEVPIAEDQDLAEMEDDDVEIQKVESKKSGIRNKDKGTCRGKDDESAEYIGVEAGDKFVEKPKKRKRSEEGRTDESTKPRKKRNVDQVAKNGQATEKQRFILFVGETIILSSLIVLIIIL